MSTATAAAERLEPVLSCPMCGSDTSRVAVTEPPYEVRRCTSCGFGWTTPRRSQPDLAAMYGADTYWRSPSPKEHGYLDYRGDQPLYLKTFRKRLDHVLRHGPRSGRALDVGCAAGFCMAALRERGFEVHGVEVSPVIAAHATEVLGFATVHVGTLQEAPLEAGSFDLVTMWDVVEHVVDPRALLRRARELLKPDGLLVLETQDIDSAFARLLGSRWQHFKYAEHIYHFTPATVRTLLSQSGFAAQELTHRYGGKYVSTAFVAERAGRLHPVASRLLAPLASWEGANLYLNFMDEMVVTARPAPG